MKLRFSPTSPYVRKVLILALETGLADKIEKIATNPWDPETDLGGDNPAGKVPALITDGGEVLYDSPVICEYLDSQHDGRKLFPREGGARWIALRRQALADAVLDAAVGMRVETSMRPEERRWPDWVARQRGVINRMLDAMEEDVAGLGGEIDISHIAFGCALGYLDFRFPDIDWRDGRPALARWGQSFAERASMQQTAPPEGA